MRGWTTSGSGVCGGVIGGSEEGCLADSADSATKLIEHVQTWSRLQKNAQNGSKQFTTAQKWSWEQGKWRQRQC